MLAKLKSSDEFAGEPIEATTNHGNSTANPLRLDAWALSALYSNFPGADNPER